jgi:anti-sigma B factor antagonist
MNGRSADSDDSHPLHVKDVVRDGKHTLILSGEIDLLAVPDLKESVRRLCIEGATEIVLDFREVTFMDSAGLQAVLSAQRLCAEHHCELSLIPGPPHIQSLFELTGLAEHLPFQQTGQPTSLPPGAILPKLFTPADGDSS